MNKSMAEVKRRNSPLGITYRKPVSGKKPAGILGLLGQDTNSLHNTNTTQVNALVLWRSAQVPGGEQTTQSQYVMSNFCLGSRSPVAALGRWCCTGACCVQLLRTHAPARAVPGTANPEQ